MKKIKRRFRYIPPKTRRQKREEAIERELAIAATLDKKPLSMRQIARRMKVAAGGWLMDILCAMADAGRILQNTFVYRGGTCKARFTFTLPPARIADVAQKAWAT